jgi:hypothetical protein
MQEFLMLGTLFCITIDKMIILFKKMGGGGQFKGKPILLHANFFTDFNRVLN